MKIDRAGWALMTSTAAYVLVLVGIEAYTASNGQPTISDRMRAGKGTVFSVAGMLGLGALMDHFWGD